MLGVSRTLIRAALVEPGLRGLVEFDGIGRTRVPVLTPQDVDKTCTVRLMIDPTAAEAHRHVAARIALLAGS